LTPTLREAKEIVDAAGTAKLVVQVGYMRRFDRGYAEAKDRVVSGFAGVPQVYRAVAHDPAPPTGWAIDPSLSGGIFYDMLSHDIDMARHLMSSEVTSVYAKASDKICEEVRKKGDYDTAVILMTFESGAFGYIEGLRKSSYGYDLRTEVVGSEGSVVVGAMNDPRLLFADKSGVRQGGASWFAGRFQEAFVKQDTSFVKSILANHAPEVSVVDGLRAVEVAEACKISVKENRSVMLAELR
jgi:predicted dehydrogenase